MAQLTDQGIREISGGLAHAQRVLRRRREHLQGNLATVEAELNELRTIESAVGMALEVLKAAAAAREEAP
jgi:hypothetical protein